jgi:hypothetical protein
VQGAVQGDVVKIESDDPIERGDGFVFELLEHAGLDPFVAAGAQRRVRHLMIEDRLDVHPRRSVTSRIKMPRKHNRSGTRGR